jgi:hypothetical protein
MLWTSSTVSWYLDGKLLHSAPAYDSLEQPMFMLLQMWSGGWEGDPDSTTPERARDPGRLRERVAAVMWDHLPAEALSRRINGKDALGRALDQMVAEKILRGWLPLFVETELGHDRRWKITPTHGPAQTYDRPGIEAFLRMVAAMG